MDPIDLIQALPARQRTKIYIKALLRLLFPAMPWPVWMAICGFAASASMIEAWTLLGASLPSLEASDLVLGFGMMLPAMALDALFRKMSPAKRSKFGYAVVPFLAVVGLCVWLVLCAQPLAHQQARIARASEVSTRAGELLLDVERRVANNNADSLASEALRLGLGRPKKAEPLVKPTLLPPLPMPAGAVASSLTPSAAREIVAAEAAQNEDFERSARVASILLNQQAQNERQALANLAQQARGLASMLLRAPSPISASLAAEPREVLLASMSIAWLAAPLAALILAHGLSTALSAPFIWLWTVLCFALRGLGRRLRPVASRLLAPEEADLAELRRMVSAYSSAQETLVECDSFMGPLAPNIDDLSVSFQLSSRSTVDIREEHLALAT